MKIRYLLPVVVLLSIPSFAQTKVEPTIALLYPHSIITTDSIREEIKVYEQEVELTQQDKEKFVHSSLAPNWKFIRENELNFRTKQNFFANLVLATQYSLIYKIIEYDADLLIFPVRETCNGDLQHYKEVANKHNVSWIVNYVNVSLYKTQEKKYLKVRLQLYNVVTHKIFLNKEYIVDAVKKGEDINCEDTKWDCAIENLILVASPDLLHQLQRNRRFWHK
jgi:hypothetical protein